MNLRPSLCLEGAYATHIFGMILTFPRRVRLHRRTPHIVVQAECPMSNYLTLQCFAFHVVFDFVEVLLNDFVHAEV